MRRTVVLCIAVATVAVAAAAVAQEGAALTLEESVAIALKQHPLIAKAEEGLVQAEIDRKDAIANFLPKLTSLYTYTRLNETPSSSFGPMPPLFPEPVTITMGTDTVQRLGVSLRQTVFDGGKYLYAYRVAQENRLRTQNDFEAVRHALASQVKQAYYGVLTCRRLVEVTRETEALAREHLRTAQERFAQGLVTRADILRTEVFLADRKQAVIEAERTLSLAQAQFNALLNRPMETPVVLAEVAAPPQETRSLAELKEKAFVRRPDLRALEHLLAMSDINISITKSGYWPTVSLQADFANDRGSATSPNSWTTSWDVVAAVSIDVWNWGQTKNKVDRARSERMKLAQDAALFRQQVELEVERAWRNLKAAEEKMASATAGEESARENLRVAGILYREGMATTADVLDAQTALAQARTAYWQSVYACRAAAAELDRATGTM